MGKNTKKKKPKSGNPLFASRDESKQTQSSYLTRTEKYIKSFHSISPKIQPHPNPAFCMSKPLEGHDSFSMYDIWDKLVRDNDKFLDFIAADYENDYINDNVIRIFMEKSSAFIKRIYCSTWKIYTEDPQTRRLKRRTKMAKAALGSGILPKEFTKELAKMDIDSLNERDETNMIMETKEEDIDIVEFFEKTLFEEIHFNSSNYLRAVHFSNEYDEKDDYVKECDELRKKYKISDIYVIPGYHTQEPLLLDIEKELNEKFEYNKQYVLEGAVMYLTLHKDVVAIDMKNAFSRVIEDVLRQFFMSGKRSDTFDENFVISCVNDYLKDDKHMVSFVSNVYRRFRSYSVYSILHIIKNQYYEIRSGIHTSAKIKEAENKKELKRLNKALAESESQNKRLNANAVDIKNGQESKVQEAVRAALKEQSEELLSVKRELKTTKDALKKAQAAKEDLESSLAEKTADTESGQSEQTDFSLSSYLKIKDLRIAFIRNKRNGDMSLFKEMEKLYPNAKFSNNIASNVIDYSSTDIVVLMTRFLKHGVYWEARDKAKLQDIPVMHCHSTNLNVIGKIIFEGITKGSSEDINGGTV